MVTGWRETMDSGLTDLKQSLLLRLLQQAGAGDAKSAQQAARLATSIAAPTMGQTATAATHASQTQISLPPTLRQLLAQHQQVQQLLPLIQSLPKAQTPQMVAEFGALLAADPKSLTSEQLRTLVSQWFASNPVQMLTSQTNTTPNSWLQALQPMLLLSLQSALSAPLRSALQGALHDIRLSQVLLADSQANQQPDYYLVLPYQLQEQARKVELLLQRRQQQAGENLPSYWLFSLRFDTNSAGPILVKGRYEQKPAMESTPPQPFTQLRLYAEGEQQRDAVQRQLRHLHQRLESAGIRNIDSQVHVGRVPSTLAPSPHELVKVGA